MNNPSQRYHRSSQREAIFDHVRQRRAHMSAEEIYAGLRPRYPRLSMGTVYRNLHILVAQKRLRVIHFGSGQDRYDARLDVHYHMVCNRCGDMIDLEMEARPDLEVAAIAHAGRFRIETHALMFYGLCGRCLDAAGEC